MQTIRVGQLPPEPLDAARAFHAQIPTPTAENLTLIFAPADHTHRAWRAAAIQSLARQSAPARVNAIASDHEPAIASAIAYLSAAPGVTGQLLELDGTGAGEVLS